MKTNSIKKYLALGLTLAGAVFTPNLQAQITEVTINGGNASSAWVWNEVTNAFTSVTDISAAPYASSTVRSYTAYFSGLPGSSPNVQLDFILSGAVGGLQDLTAVNSSSYANTETNAVGIATNTPVVAISSTTPEAVGLSSSIFNEAKTLVAPYVFIKNNNTALTPGLLNVTNLTQRQAAYLVNSAGPNFHSAYIGGPFTNDSVYFVGRNTASAVRTEIDANIYFTGTPATYTTNSSGQPIFDTAGGQSSGSNIRALVGVITNAIGTVAIQDVKTFTPLAYEGVPYAASNVVNGTYPLWGYEHWYTLKSGSLGPNGNQQAVINQLLSFVTNSTQQASSIFTGGFVSYGALNVQRSVDGGPITWIH